MAGADDGAGPSKSNDGKDDQSSTKAKLVAQASDALKKLNIQDKLNFTKTSSSMDSSSDMAKHKFWTTQPVPRFDEPPAPADGPIDPEDLSKVPKEPYPLIEGFEWVTMDLTNPTELDDVYTLLNQNYVEDHEAMFRFAYSASFLTWALMSPGWRKEWHIGIRASQSRKLVAFISGVPCTLRVRKSHVQCSEINFLCVHKKLRSKRLAPVLIREVTRRCNLLGIWQAIYTGGILLPTPVSTCRYYHRALDWPKLHEVGFSPLPPGSTKQRMTLRMKLPTETSIKGLREMALKDVDAVLDLLKRYLATMDMAQEFTRDEVQHWLVNEEPEIKNKVVYSYVVEHEGKVTDFFSFYSIPSTVIGNPVYQSINVAYLFYYASESAFSSENGAEKAVLKKRLNELINDALILAKKAEFDVFNALTLLDNPLFLQDQKFGAGDGRLHYYLYNYRAAPVPGGINAKSEPDVGKMGGVGVVML